MISTGTPPKAKSLKKAQMAALHLMYISGKMNEVEYNIRKSLLETRYKDTRLPLNEEKIK